MYFKNVNYKYFIKEKKDRSWCECVNPLSKACLRIQITDDYTFSLLPCTVINPHGHDTCTF